jgi:thymidylate synthase
MERFYIADLPELIKLLKKNLNTRQAYFPIFNPVDIELANQGDRIPCTLGYHFQYFGGRLNINYYIRSCDAFRHFHNDVYFTARLLQHVCNSLDIGKVLPGNLYMYIANFHVFENDMYHIDKRIKKWKPV